MNMSNQGRHRCRYVFFYRNFYKKNDRSVSLLSFLFVGSLLICVCVLFRLRSVDRSLILTEKKFLTNRKTTGYIRIMYMNDAVQYFFFLFYLSLIYIHSFDSIRLLFLSFNESLF